MTKPSPNVIYAYEPDQTLRELLGKSTLMSDIFTADKIKACQQRVDAARISFFVTSERDMEAINAITRNKALEKNYEEICRQVFQPLSNIKGQAEVFGFSLIACICKYLMEYCESNSGHERLSSRDTFIIARLIEALRRAFQEKIVDAGGTIEKQLVSVIEQTRKHPV